MTKHGRRDKESVAKSHRNKITRARSSESDRPGRMREATRSCFYGSSRRELSTLAPQEAKPSTRTWIPAASFWLSGMVIRLAPRF